MKSLMICNNSSVAVKRLFEAASAGSRYVLEGPAAEFDVINRNGRIYTKDEYLKHLEYLRDDLKKNEPILGELDHPDDRFEVKIKEASHRILDLWYDEKKNGVMIKIELLDTPNGKLAKSLVDEGVPLHISSRAAGTVNSDNTVSIQQIYTYDLVAKPGFANAVLHRVNESADGDKYTDDVKEFLEESNKTESMNFAPQLGFLNEDISMMDINSEPNLRHEAKKLQNDNMFVNEEETMEDVNVNATSECGCADDDCKKNGMNEDDEAPETEDSDENKDSDDENAESVEIVEVYAVDADGNKVDFDEDSDEDSDEDDDKDSDDENAEPDEDSDDESGEENGGESDDASECSRSASDDENAPDATKKNKLFDCSDVQDRKEKMNDKFDELIANIKKKNECVGSKANESVMTQYPVSMSLDERNFAAFSSLDESQKRKVVDYLRDRKVTNPDEINETWKNGINYVAAEPVWLKFAPAYYRNIYESSSDSVKKSIRYTAEFVMFENQSDVNTFWENTGLASKSQRALLNEEFINTMPKFESVNECEELPYGKAFIDRVVEMACKYND